MTDPAFPDDRYVLDPGCGRCPALVDCRMQITWGNGPIDADVMVVGEAPAAGEPDAERWRGGNLTGYAYTSRHSGRRVRRLFAECGYADRVFFTNAVKCFPRDPDADGETNREPTDEELAACRDHLKSELDRVAPAVVCPTGSHATESVLALANSGVDDVADGFLDCVLDPIPIDVGDVADAHGGRDPADSATGLTVLPLLHPSYRDVWAARLGYADGDAYREAVADALDACM